MTDWMALAKRVKPLMQKAAQSLDDADGSIAPEMFPTMAYDGSLIAAGTRVRWGGGLKRAAADLWDTPQNTPDAAPALWEDVAYKDGYRLIPETITATLAFALDECGWWKDVLYRSLRDGNVYNPDVTPEWWEVVT